MGMWEIPGSAMNSKRSLRRAKNKPPTDRLEATRGGGFGHRAMIAASGKGAQYGASQKSVITRWGSQRVKG